MARNTTIRRVRPEDIVEFISLYKKLGTYAEVARNTDFSASTVARYVKMNGTDKPVKMPIHEAIPSA